jgi:hypothetical protein
VNDLARITNEARSEAGFIFLGRDGEVGFSLRLLAECCLEAMRRSPERGASASAHCGAVSDDPASCANSSPHRRSLRENPRSPPSIRCCLERLPGSNAQRNAWLRPAWSLPAWQAGSTPGGQGLLVAHVEYAIPIANPARPSETVPPVAWTPAAHSRERRMASSQHPASKWRDRALPPGGADGE